MTDSRLASLHSFSAFHALRQGDMLRGRALRQTLALGSVAALSLACVVPVDGDRATTGSCPMGETCSQATPAGLTFVGRSLFDGEMPQLGPVAQGGTLEVGLVGLTSSGDGDALLSHEARVDDDAVLAVEVGTGEFGPLDSDGQSIFPVDAHVMVSALGAGTGTLRIVDPASGELYDRTSLDAVSIDEVTVVSAAAPGRDHLFAGCEETIGVSLLSGVSRAIDDSMTVRIDGVLVQAEPLTWDTVVVRPGEGQERVTFEIHAGGRDFTRTMPVSTLADAGLDACPAARN